MVIHLLQMVCISPNWGKGKSVVDPLICPITAILSTEDWTTTLTIIIIIIIYNLNTWNVCLLKSEGFRAGCSLSLSLFRARLFTSFVYTGPDGTVCVLVGRDYSSDM